MVSQYGAGDGAGGGGAGGDAGGDAAARSSVYPYGYRVDGAGSAEVDGLYVRDGEYGGAPLFKKGRLWLLRYRIPSSGNLWWYIADNDLSPKPISSPNPISNPNETQCLSLTLTLSPPLTPTRYIADKDSLDKDDGDLYRIRCAEPGDEGLPPTRAVSRRPTT